MVALKKSLRELSTLSEQLNQSTDELNHIIESLEAKLADASPGVSVWLDKYPRHELVLAPTRNEEDEPIITFWEIGYAKVQGVWRLAARQRHKWESGRDQLGDPEFGYQEGIWQELPLSQAPRAVRVEAAPLLDDLVQAITARVQTFIGNIEKAKTLVE